MKNFLIGGKILLTSILFVVSITIVSAITPSSGGGGGGGGSYTASPIPNFTGQTVVLSPGWNTFSTPKILDSITFQSGGTGLYFYSLTSTGWQAIVPTKDTIKPLEGFMINNTNLTDSIISLTYKQNPTPLEMIFQKQLHVGWNILGITTMYSPFSTIGAGGTMAVDFTRNSNGSTNYANKVTSDFYSKIGDISLGELLLGESYGIFMQSPVFYAGVQNPNSGTNNPPPTTTGSILTGSLSVILDGTAVAQYVPQNAANVKVGSIRFSAGSSNVTIQSLVVSRSGLGSAYDITSSNGIRASQNGNIISSIADYYDPTSQKATIYFSPALTIAGGSSQNIDILVNLSGSNNSQHQFTLDSVNASGAITTGTPITLGLLNTTSYTTTTTMASIEQVASIIPSGKANQLFGKIDISAGGRETKITGFTLTRSGATEFTKRLTNVKLYKNGVSVGTVSMTANTISVSGLADILASGNTQTYELRADTLFDGSSNLPLGIKINSTTDVSAVEVNTGYATTIVLGNSSIIITFGAVEFTFTKQSTGNVTIAPGTNNVKIFDGKLQSTAPVSVRKLTISTPFFGTGITAFVNDQLSVKLNGIEIGTLTSLNGNQNLTVSFVVDYANPAVITIEGSTKNNPAISPSTFQFNVILSELRDSNYNLISNIGAGSNLTGDRTIIASAEVEVKTATIAAPSTTRIYSSAEQEIGRFAITSRNEVARLQSITLTASTSNGTIQQIANSTSSAKLVDVATGLEVSTTVTISGNNITFSSMNDIIGKDVTKNYKVMLGVSSVDLYYGMTLNLIVSTGSISVVRDSNSANITPTGSATTKSYTVGTVAPTVLVTAINENTFKIRVTNPDSNTGITLTSTKLDFKTALPGNTSYTAIACLRDLGNTNTCGGAGTSGSSSVPALSQTLIVGGLTANMTADKNGGYIEFEVYITSANLLPTGGQLQVALTQLYYTVGGNTDSETYVGTTGASASFTK